MSPLGATSGSSFQPNPTNRRSVERRYSALFLLARHTQARPRGIAEGGGCEGRRLLSNGSGHRRLAGGDQTTGLTGPKTGLAEVGKLDSGSEARLLWAMRPSILSLPS